MAKSAPPGVGHHNCHAGLYVISGDRCFRAPGGSRSFRYSSIARMISFLTFSIVTSSRRWIVVITAGHVEAFPRCSRSAAGRLTRIATARRLLYWT